MRGNFSNVYKNFFGGTNMAKRTTATNWEVVVRDESGAMVNIDYVCPHCGCASGAFISIGASGVSCLDGSWETDQVCEVCDQDIIIVCL